MRIALDQISAAWMALATILPTLRLVNSQALSRVIGACAVALSLGLFQTAHADLVGQVDGNFQGYDFGAYQIPYTVPICVGLGCADPAGQYTVDSTSIDVYASGLGLSFYNSGKGGSLTFTDTTANPDIIGVTPTTYTFPAGPDGEPSGGSATATFTSDSVTIHGTGVWPAGSDASFDLQFSAAPQPPPPPPPPQPILVNIYADAFIPSARLDNPAYLLGLSPYATFAGDNRGFQLGGTARIYQGITVDLNPSDPTVVSQLQNTGITTGYTGNGQFAMDRAPADGLTESTTSPGGSSVDVEITGVASNPLVPGAPSIFQNYVIRLGSTDGNIIDYAVSGSTKTFPAYELYIGCQLVYSSSPSVMGPLALLAPPTTITPFSGQISETDASGCSPGQTESFPIMPTSYLASTYVFSNVDSGLWFDPLGATSFDYQMTSASDFTEISGFPTDCGGSFDVYVGGTYEGSFGGGDDVILPKGTTSFTIAAVNPNACGDQPFPLRLEFSTAVASFDITPNPAPTSPLPEPGSIALFGVGLIGVRLFGTARPLRARIPRTSALIGTVDAGTPKIIPVCVRNPHRKIPTKPEG